MAERPERVLAIDADSGIVRGMVLAAGPPAVAGGYAQLGFEPSQDPATFAARIAAALDVKTTLPVVVTCTDALGRGVCDQVAAAIAELGFASVTVEDRAAAARRANPAGGQPASLVDVDIPTGLLTSHAGLTLADLAPVVGAALGVLRGTSYNPDAADPIPVWTPETEAPPAPNTDPFTGAPLGETAEPEPSAGIAGAAIAASGGTAVADEFTSDDDDITIAAPSSLGGEDTDLPGDETDLPGEDTDLPGEDTDLPGDETDLSGEDTDLPGEDTDLSGDETDLSGEDTDLSGEPAEDASESEQPILEDDDTGLSSAAATAAAAAGGVAALTSDDADLPGDDTDVSVAGAAVEAAARGDDELDETQQTSQATSAAIAAAGSTVGTAQPAAAAPPTSSYVPQPPPSEGDAEGERSKRPMLLLLLGALVVAAIAALAISQCGASVDSDDVVTQADTPAPTIDAAEPTAAADTSQPAADAATDEPAATPDPAASSGAAASDPTATTAPDPEPTATAEAEPTPTPEPEPTSDPLEGLPPLSSLPERGAVFRPPTLFLEGPVQTQEQADALYERAIAVVGPDNVVNNYVVRPDAPPAIDGNVRVEQAVLFETGSAVISEEFIPTLELGVAVMALNPQVQMVIEGHTDSVGSDESNLALSQQRAQAVLEYLVSRGVDRSRLTPIGLGETAPVATNETAEGRQINRRIEVELLDLLAGE